MKGQQNQVSSTALSSATPPTPLILAAIGSLSVLNTPLGMLPRKSKSILTSRYPCFLPEMEQTRPAIATSSADTSAQPATTAQTGTIVSDTGTPPVASDDTKDEFPYRVEVLYEPKTFPAFPVQIVFVHGLNGSKRGTWTHSNKQFWPKWLHEEKGLEDVRILTFGYNSSTNVLKPNTDLSIPSFANQLLRYLSQLNYKTGLVLFLILTGADYRWRQRFSWRIVWVGWL